MESNLKLLMHLLSWLWLI